MMLVFYAKENPIVFFGAKPGALNYFGPIEKAANFDFSVSSLGLILKLERAPSSLTSLF